MADAVDTDRATCDAKNAGTIGFGARLDRAIGRFLEVTTAALVVAEIVILFVGILARYVFHRPLVWSDELASILFLWLAVLGSRARVPPRRKPAHDDGGEQAVAAGAPAPRGRSRWLRASRSSR